MTVPSYYGRPVLKKPVWKRYVPAYFFTGGLAAGTALLSSGFRLSGDRPLARRCRIASVGAVAISTGLLVADLGRPARFLNMLRVAKPTSPMSVGSWVLATFGAASTVALLGPDGPVAAAAEITAAGLAPVLATYTAVLIADTAVPAWHNTHCELPFVFAGGALASSGAVAALLSDAPQARRAGVLGAALELGASAAMRRRLRAVPSAAEPGRADRLSTIAQLATAGGAGLIATRKRAANLVGAALLLTGALAERLAIFETGIESIRPHAQQPVSG